MNMQMDIVSGAAVKGLAEKNSFDIMIVDKIFSDSIPKDRCLIRGIVTMEMNCMDILRCTGAVKIIFLWHIP